MNRLIARLVLYADLPEYSLLRNAAKVCRQIREDEYESQDALRAALHALQSQLLRLAWEKDFSGNLWQMYLTWVLVAHETPYGLYREGDREAPEMMQALFSQDAAVFYTLFHPNQLLRLPAEFRDSCDLFGMSLPESSASPLSRLHGRLAEAEDEAAFAHIAAEWIAAHGCGAPGLFHSFRVHTNPLSLVPVENADPVMLNDLVGYALQKDRLRQNVEAFLAGLPCNNMLLYGDAGTGKSTSVRALANEYGEQGLRLVELTAEQFSSLPDLIAMLRRRHYFFLLFIDDLSYDSGDTGYRFLKAALEGGLETRPSNVLVCATSNRRHLVQETWKDRDDMEHDGDIHRSDTVEEKLSLAGRFGCLIQYYAGDRNLFEQIVLSLAERYPQLHMSSADILAAATRWELRHGGLSGRTAQHFINALVHGGLK